MQGAQIDLVYSLFFLQTFSWGKTHESFWCAWGFFLKDDDDAVVRILNVLGCFITGGCSGLSSADPLVCCSLVLRFSFFSLCVCLLLLSLHVYSCVFYKGLFLFSSSLCGALGELGLNPVLYVPWSFAGSAINRSVNLAPSLSGCWGSDAGASHS